MKSEQLTEIGLTKNQAKVYLEILKTPEQTGGEISKKLSIDRSFAYGILAWRRIINSFKVVIL